MRKGRELIGLPILQSISGQRLGEVQDLVLDPINNAVSGFLIDKGNWFRSPRQVSVQSVLKVNGDEIKVENGLPFEYDRSQPLISSLSGKKVATSGGKIIGSIQDIILDESCFRLTGYEISDGLISDLVSGRAIIHTPNIITQSDHVVVVDDGLATIWDS